MTTVNIHEAKSKLSDLIRRVLRGEEVVISRRNVPLVRMVSARVPGEGRTLGWARGRIELTPDFDALPEEFSDYE
ncbi:MAG: type II toxin-antitoxin system prevent-host-death family antitoxin [Deltaproteobacteria bacterium]|nr:type II toxin-antitoxin system prevent-host-death family antitoxin [Deltaproteobacteria bacterium]